MKVLALLAAAGALGLPPKFLVVGQVSTRVVGGHRVRVLQNLLVSNVGHRAVTLRCSPACPRVPGTHRRTAVHKPGAVYFQHLNLIFGRRTRLIVTLAGAPERFKTLAVRGLHLQLVRQGCRSGGRVVACRAIPVPVPGPAPAPTPTPSATPVPSPTPPADTTPPDTTITSAPSGDVYSQSASISFSATEPGSASCRLDGGAWSACTSPASYSALGAGAHTFAVRATDGAGNTDPTPATATWTTHVPVRHYDCPGTPNAFGHYVPSGKYWGNSFTAQGGRITAANLAIGAASDGGDHRATIGIYTGGDRSGPLEEVTVNVTGYDGETVTFPTPIGVTPGQSLWVIATGVGDFTAYDRNDNNVDGCFEGWVDGWS
jgi:hypothetical protein